MKRYILFVLIVSLSVVFTACSKNDKNQKNDEIADVTKPAHSSVSGNEPVDKAENGENAESNAAQSKEMAEKKDTAEKKDAAEETKPNTEPELKSESEQGNTGSVNLSEVRSEIISKVSISDAMLIETSAMAKLYGVSESDVKQSAGFVTMSGTFPHEIIMIEAVDSSSADDIANALSKKLNEVLNQSKSYDAKNYELAQQCRVNRKGNYVSLFLSPDHEAMLSVYNSYIK